MAIAIITGASGGIGREFVRQIAGDREVDAIWVLARRVDRLAELQGEIDKRLVVKGIDLACKSDLNRFNEELKAASPNVKYLVNCAGLGYIGAFDGLKCEEIARMIDINCTALSFVTYYVLPYINDGGAIINLASSAAFLPQPNFAVYAASKSYVLSLSRALREELKPRKIKVTAVCPGPVKTEFFDIAEVRNKIAAYKKKYMVNAKDVVCAALRASARGKAVTTYSISMKSFRLACKILPHKWLVRLAK